MAYITPVKVLSIGDDRGKKELLIVFYEDRIQIIESTGAKYMVHGSNLHELIALLQKSELPF